MVDTYSKWYDISGEGVEVTLGKLVFPLTVACDLDNWHTEQGYYGVDYR